MRFAGKSAFITGAASGIGKAIAELLAREGAGRLILVDADPKGLEELGWVVMRTSCQGTSPTRICGHPQTLARSTMR